MRKIIVVAMILVSIAAFTAPAYCKGWHCEKSPMPVAQVGDDFKGDCLQKLGRGFSNCLTFVMEIPNQISNVNKANGPLVGFTWGLLKGVGMSGVRAAVGIYEIVTFPLPCPAGYAPILTDPEYFFADKIW